jgi:uncharacterized protein with beta-barrel porin domain
VLFNLFRRTGTWRPRFAFTYRREFSDPVVDASLQFVQQPDTKFVVDALPLPKDTVIARGGLTYRTASGLEYTFGYEFRQADDEVHQSVDFRVRFK